MPSLTKISPCLWFDHEAEEAARFYTGIFPNSSITETMYYTEIGHEFHQKPAGSVMTVDFVLDGLAFTALNGGPVFRFNEAISFQILCDSQQEIDHYWKHLTEGGDEKAQQCGWLKDKFGVSWQVAPNALAKMMRDPDIEKVRRVTAAMLGMKKIDLETLERVYQG